MRRPLRVVQTRLSSCGPPRAAAYAGETPREYAARARRHVAIDRLTAAGERPNGVGTGVTPSPASFSV